MTFILSCATEDAVYQVSDRRLTWVSGPDLGTVKDDESNKAVLIDGRMAFGYTGIAEINGRRTDYWLARLFENVATQNLAAVTEHIRSQATMAFTRMSAPDRQSLRHAFVGVGWGTYRGERTLNPLLVTISNALNAAGEWDDLPSAEFGFVLNRWGVNQVEFSIASVGQTISAPEKKSIWRHVGRVVRKGAPRRAMLGSLINSCLWIAGRHSSVGRSLMALCIPKSAALRQLESGVSMAIAGAPGDDFASFIYVPADGKQAVQYGPHFAAGGGVATDFSVTPL